MGRTWVAVLCVAALVIVAAGAVFFATVGASMLSNGLAELAARSGPGVAVTLYRWAVSANPYDAAHRLALCRLYLQQGQQDAALALLQAGIDGGWATGPDLYLALASLYADSGRLEDACALLEKDPLRDDGGAVLTSLGFADMVWAARLTPYTPGDDNVEAFPVKAGGEVLEHVELRQKLSDQRLDALLASLYNMGYRPWQAELPGLDMNFTEMPVADQKRQMEILHMALGMLMNAPRGDACIMMAPGDMLPDLISDTPRKDVQLFTITVRRPTATLIVDMTAYSASF